MGSLTAGFVYRRGMDMAPAVFNERNVILAGNFLLTLGFLLLVPYRGAEWVPPPGLFYAGTGLLSCGYTASATCAETILAKKVQQYADVVGGHVAKYMSVLYAFISAGRFAGPLIVAAITRIATPAGDTFVCTTGWIFEPDGDVTCNGPPDLQCGVTASDY